MAGARRPAGAGSAATPPAARPRPQRAASRAKPAGAALALCAAALVAWLRRTPPTVDSLEASLAARLGPQRTGDAALAELTPWLAARGAKLAGARAAVFPGGLRGLALAADVPAGAELLSLPLDATLSAVTCSFADHLKVALAPDPLRMLGEEEEPHLYVSTVVVLNELLLAPAHSAWTIYLRTLPRSFPDLPAFFEDTRGGIDGAPRLWTRLGALAPLVAAQREEMATLLPFVARAIARLPRGPASLAALAPGELPRLAAWAWAVGRTRMLDQWVEDFPRGREVLPLELGIKKAPVLMPFIDFANHAEPDAPERTAGVTTAGGVIRVLAQRSASAGEELRFTYRDTVADVEEDESVRDELCNDQWLSHYGFLLQDGKPERDCFHFELSLERLRQLLGPAAAPGRGARRRLQAAGLPEALHTVIDGTGAVWEGLPQWLSVAGGTAPPDLPPDDAWQGDVAAFRTLAQALAAAGRELQAVLRDAEARNEAHGGDGEAVRQLAAGALRAAAAAEAQARDAVRQLTAED